MLVASGLMPAGARSVAEQLGIRYMYAGFHLFEMPSAHYLPSGRPGPPPPPGMTDDQALWDLDAQKVNALYLQPLNAHRAAIGLPPVDNVRDHVFGDRPWLAADPVLGPWEKLTKPRPPADRRVDPARRTAPAERPGGPPRHRLPRLGRPGP
ncbi:hypothetical protein ACFWWM_38055 [Streptomyces sp. NPDC058682]|uniref:hypothetical protein n=1 Tax=Streptomyces sp. NPDC058682 TaxID=3346596 RepID=UPI00366571BF